MKSILIYTLSKSVRSVSTMNRLMYKKIKSDEQNDKDEKHFLPFPFSVEILCSFVVWCRITDLILHFSFAQQYTLL